MKIEIVRYNERQQPASAKEAIDKLYRELKRDFPPHHWNHLNVWSAYWHLVETIKHN